MHSLDDCAAVFTVAHDEHAVHSGLEEECTD
jgi:hypothetical protein